MDQVVTDASKSSKEGSARGGFGAVRFAPLFAIAVAALAGCTVMLETERKQCSKQDDCVQLFGADEPYLCIANVCERPTCQSTSQCRANAGVGFEKSVCDVASNRCAPPECTDTPSCGSGRACDLTKNECVAAQCQTTEECQRNPDLDTPTVQCTGGLCIDDKWGCIGDPDERPRLASEQAIMRVPLVSSDNLQPLPDAVWRVRVCRLPTLDPDCLSEYPIERVDYDPATGVVSIVGVPPGVSVRFMFDETSQLNATGSQSKYLPMDFYTQRPAVGDTLAKPVRVVNRDGLAVLIQSFLEAAKDQPQPVDASKGNIYGAVFDCAGNPAADVELSYNSVLGTALLDRDGKAVIPTMFYFNEQGQPSLEETHKFTFTPGVFSSLGFPVKVPFLATTSVVWTANNPGKKRVIRKGYQLFMPEYPDILKSRMTTVHFYPRNYETPSN